MTQRPISIAVIPPFRGGPLQPRSVSNHQIVSNGKRIPEDHKPTLDVKSTATSTVASRDRQRERSNTRGNPDSPSKRSSATSASRPKPTTRFEREAKKDYKDPHTIGPWNLGELIGSGASGRVRLASHSQTGQKAAVKIIPKQALTASRMDLENLEKSAKLALGVEREIVIMKLIEHPNLLGLWDVFETTSELYLVMEHVAGGELFDHLVAEGRFRPRQARSYFRQIIFGVDYCHRFNICHRDLKPENLLLDSTKRVVKVADFGMAAMQSAERMLETSCGSPHYASPEVIRGIAYDGTASDIWSCGVILFALLCGRLPFDHPKMGILMRKVQEGLFEMPESLDPSAKDLIWRMIQVDPTKRITMAALLRHPWFTDNGNEASVNPVTTSLDEVGTGALDPERLDGEIVGNLQTLWPKQTEEELVQQLTVRGPNWQKTFYSLLVAHRDNHAGDDDDFEVDEQGCEAAYLKRKDSVTMADIRSTQQAGKAERPRPRHSLDSKGRSREGASASAFTSPQRPHEASASPVSEALGSSPSVDRQSGKASPGKCPAHITTFSNSASASSAKQTARRSSLRRHAVEIPGTAPPSHKALTPTIAGGRTLPKPPTSQASHEDDAVLSSLARRATSPTSRGGSPVVSQGVKSRKAPDTPSSRLRAHARTTPESSKLTAAAFARPQSRAGASTSGSRPASLHGTPTANSVPATEVPTLPVPQAGDSTVQRFFQEIADELALVRGTGNVWISDTKRSDRLQDSANAVNDTMQFEDAAEDCSPETAKTDTGNDDTLVQTSRCQLPPAQIPPQTAPLVVVGKSAQAMTKTASACSSSVTAGETATPASQHARSPRSMSVISSPPIRSTAKAESTGSTRTSSRARSLLRGSSVRRRESQKETSDGVDLSKPTAKRYEDMRAGAPPRLTSNSQNSNVTKEPSRLLSKSPGLGLDFGQPQTGLLNVASRIDGSSSPVSSSYSSRSPSLSSAPSSPMPKQWWFSGLFSWKQAHHTILSTEPIGLVTNEVRRLLTSYGVTVILEDSENLGIFKCSVAELRDGSPGSSNNVSSTKLARFRIHFTILPVSSATPLASPLLGQPGIAASLAYGGSQGYSRQSAALPSPALSQTSRASTESRTVAYATRVLLVQEKGPLNTFRQVHTLLRRDWAVGQLRGSSTPAVGLGLGL